MQDFKYIIIKILKKTPRRLYEFVAIVLTIIFFLAACFSVTAPGYDDEILGSEYQKVAMPIPTMAPAPPSEASVKTSKHEAELSTVFNQPEKVAFLTFDDGPTANITPQILDILKENGIQATFFALGSCVAKNPEIAKRAAAEGHIFANHTYSHVYNHIYENTENFVAEIKSAEELFLATVGEDHYVKVFRFPGGSFEAKKTPYKDALKEIGYYYVDWNAINADAEGHNVSPEVQLKNIRETTKNKRNVVILMHDAPTKQTTADALPQIISYLRSQGFVFRTLKDISLS